MNDAPLAGDSSQTTDEDVAVDGAVSGSDVDGDPLTYSLLSSPENGSLTFNSDGTYRYVPNADYHGSGAFSFRVNDGTVSSPNLGRVSLTVTPVNDTPVAVTHAATINEDQSLTSSLDVADVDGDSLTFAVIDGPRHGTLLVNPNRSIVYTPDGDYHGTDSFTWQASDGSLVSNVAGFTITINPVNDAPVAVSSSAIGDEDTPLTGSVSGTDIDGDVLSFSLATSPQHGNLQLNSDGSYVYTPHANYHGSDSFSFRASDGSAVSGNVGIVSLSINSVNDAPVASNASVTINEDQSLTIYPGGSDVDRDPLTLIIIAAPQHGTLSPNDSRSVVYRPDADYFGTDSFTWVVSDGQASSNVGTFTITLLPVNDGPSISNQSLTVDENSGDGTIVGTLQASDADGDDLAWAITAGNASGAFAIDATTGTVTVADGGQLDFEATPTLVLTVQVTDSAGVTASATVTVQLNDIDETLRPAIDIKPGDDSNTINIDADSTVQVAILSTADFDASTVDVASLTFGATGDEDSLVVHRKRGTPRFSFSDVNGDGLLDLVVDFNVSQTGLTTEDTQAILKGQLADGTPFKSVAAVTVTTGGGTGGGGKGGGGGGKGGQEEVWGFT